MGETWHHAPGTEPMKVQVWLPRNWLSRDISKLSKNARLTVQDGQLEVYDKTKVEVVRGGGYQTGMGR